MARWITVSNRLPFSINSENHRITTSSGGLVSALSGVKGQGERLWVGCAPEGLASEDWPEIERGLASSVWKYHPVFAPKDLYDLYYNGCCNDVLWPLLHYQSELVSFDMETWQAYRQMNERIANEIAAVANTDDLVWIHDFHLFLVPKILKAARPELKVGFFLHVPFPSSEVFRQLPVREEILLSLLEADLVGFHDYSYLRHFCSTILRLLGLESSFLSVKHNGHTTKLGVFPVSIDTEDFMERAKDPNVLALTENMDRPTFLFLGVDRLDYMKGLDLKLKSFRTLLKRYPQYREKVSLLQVAVPTRQGVPVYMELARQVAQLIGEINGEFSTPNWTPVQYIHASVSHDQLIALYRSADALLVTSKRDGMNLVALEYIASQDRERPGVVLLSEFAGAISTLSHTLAINPWDLEDTARKMQIAMEMPRQEKIYRLETMQRHLQQYTATNWAETFIQELDKNEIEVRRGPRLISPTPAVVEKIAETIIESATSSSSSSSIPIQRIVLFLDYDGTLVPIEPSPELAVLPSETAQAILEFEKYTWLQTVVVSGRDSRFMGTQFAGMPVHLAAEHGAKYFDPAVGRWQRRIHRSRSSWYPTALKIISDYTSRVPHSQVEKKHFALAWHYRQSPQDFAEFQALKLSEELELGLANLPVSILRGKKVIEVRATEADKGVFARAFLENAPPGTFAVTIGDDRTDEDLFHAIHGRGISFKVGLEASAADFALPSQGQVLGFIQKLLTALDTRMSSQTMRRAPTKKSAKASSAGTELKQ